ncbi:MULTISPECIES: TetR/AcrR family transcriptional regulator [unclassified Methylobacterium]|jgi:AcrR family transcriptional regulator|uniref:TetR/AcrR family transcriptional regulator n=1 Tax=unclassified Methylobacterium TaxID=2615210 RepID=UPI0013552C09|nr:TetR/AcrR family transcriptional regulator [Methylobacterium sp. 2A]MWV23273.1 TetR/AcrR family transcriptional regulator [Methylobacterium sp. 2A]
MTGAGGAAQGTTRSRAKPGAPRRTRARILEACRALFNARGPGTVTTAEIAEAVGINEGNLYYHFQRKEQVLEALFAEFEQALRATATAYAASHDGTDRYRTYLTGWFRTMWEWRFFYRDGGVVFRLAPQLRPRLKTLSDEGQTLTRQALEAMEQAGLMAIPADRLDPLVINAWIVSAYWIDYLRSRRGIDAITPAHIDWGAQQVLNLFLPYLTPQGRAATEAGRRPAASRGAGRPPLRPAQGRRQPL